MLQKSFKELEKSSSIKAKKALAVKDKVKKSKPEQSAKKVIEEIEQIETDKKSKKVKKESFNPKAKIGEYIASTSDGFNMEEVLNPGELALEDICKELGLIDENV